MKSGKLSSVNSQLPKVDATSLPKGWEIKKLGEVCEKIFAGGDKPKEYSKFQTNEFCVPIFANGEKNKGLYGYTNTARISKPSITISGRGTIGYSEIRTHPFVPIVRLITLLSNEEVVDINFLHYGIKNIDFKNSGSSIPQLTVPMVKGYSIPIPPLPEQKRIVSILDRVFEAIDQAKANAEQNLKNTKEVFENSLQEIFDNKNWEQNKLGELAFFKNGMNYTKSSKGQSIEIVGVKNFKNNFWVPFQELEEVIIDGELNETYLLKKGDIIAVRSNGNPKLIGRTLIADNLNGKISHSGFTIRIRLNTDNILPIFLCHYLKTQKTRDELVKKGNGVGIKSLNQGSLSSLIIPFPKSLKEQKDIIVNIEKISGETKKLESIYQQKIEDLEELKKSVLQKAFSGEL